MEQRGCGRKRGQLHRGVFPLVSALEEADAASSSPTGGVTVPADHPSLFSVLLAPCLVCLPLLPVLLVCRYTAFDGL